MQSQGRSTYITTNATTVISAVPGVGGVLQRITVGAPGTAWVIDVFDSTTGTGTLLTSISVTGAQTFEFNLQYSNGLSVVTSGTAAGKATVVWT